MIFHSLQFIFFFLKNLLSSIWSNIYVGFFFLFDLNIVFNIVIFSIVLIIYKLSIFLVFLSGSALYIMWVFLFLKKRRELDFKQFAQLADNQTKLIQLINGMQEIKLNNYERQKRWEWERIQARLFKVNIQSLSLQQYQQAGSVFINETKNIVITIMMFKVL